MKVFILFTVIALAVVPSKSEINKELFEKAKAAAVKCMVIHDIDEFVMLSIAKNHVAPVTMAEKCLVHCYFKEMGYFHDAMYDLAVFQELDGKKWDDPETIAKANEVIVQCISQVKTEENECEASAKLLTCSYDEMKKRGIELPDVLQ